MLKGVSIMVTNGYNTKQKRLIMSFLKDNKSISVTVKDIYDYLLENNEKVNITTIYRYLDKLTEQDIVMKFASDDGKNNCYQYIEGIPDCNEHLHLRCIECGKVIHLDCEYMDGIVKHISECHGFDLKCDNSVLYGRCKECQKKKK